MPAKEKEVRKKSYHKKFIESLEHLFYNWGLTVANNPWMVICLTTLLTALCSLGFLQFRMQYRTDHLWIPSTSKFRQNTQWKNENFKKNSRYQNVIFKSDNILTPEGVQKMFRVHKRMLEFSFNNSSFEDFCLLVPVTNFDYTGQVRKYTRGSLPLVKHDHGGDIRDNIFGGRIGRTLADTSLDMNISVKNRDDIHDHDTDEVRTSTFRSISNKFKREVSTPATIDQDDVYEEGTDGSGDHGEEALKIVEFEDTTFPTMKDIINNTDRDVNDDDELINPSKVNVEDNLSEEDEFNVSGYSEPVGGDSVNNSEDDYEYDDEYDLLALYDQYDTSDKPADTLAEAIAALSSDDYCELVSSIGKACFQQSLLELWSFDEEMISKLTQQDIIDAVNLVSVSPWFFTPRNYSADLGTVTRNYSGHIVGAEAAWVHIITDIPEDTELVDPGGIGVGVEVQDRRSLEFERHLVRICSEESGGGGVEVRPASGSSFNDVSFEALFFDIYKVGIGYVIMFVYTVIMLGRMTWTEVRLYLSGMGILSCVMGLASAMGITFLLGLEYNQTHNVLPFIAIGIGIDDMFVIMECWYNMVSEPNTSTLSLPEKIGRTLQHAGVSITVTSVTDVLAFALGSYTLMPGLQAFCVSAAISIAFIYLLQVSWFVAWLALDQQRVEAHRHGIFFWKTNVVGKEASKNEKDEGVHKASLGKQVMEIYGPRLESRWFLVIVVTFCFLGFGLYGSASIEQRFQPQSMVPSDSYFYAWMELQGEHFPAYGYFAWVMTGPLDWTALAGMEDMLRELQEVAKPGPDRILSTIESWWPPFKTFLELSKNMSWTDVQDDDMFHSLMSDFLFSVEHAQHQASFRFSAPLQCGDPAPPIIATQQKLYYGMSSSNPPPTEYLPAKQAVDHIVDQSNVSVVAFVLAPIYQAWETDAIITTELWRNIGMAMIAVGFVSLLFLGSIKLCLMVMACVILTLVDLVGTLHFWGVNIDVVSCVNVVLAIGLSVDYSVHIANAFKSSKGSARCRTQAALTSLGPAVFNGGVTTLLAVIVLPGSKSHILVTFFKVFGLTVMYGLFHGLVLLPVLLGWCQVGEDEEDPRAATEDEEDPRAATAQHVELGSMKPGDGIVNESYRPDHIDS